MGDDLLDAEHRARGVVPAAGGRDRVEALPPDLARGDTVILRCHWLPLTVIA